MSGQSANCPFGTPSGARTLDTLIKSQVIMYLKAACQPHDTMWPEILSTAAALTSSSTCA